MCKKLLLVVTLLSFAAVASAEILIDDFENPPYWGQPALDMAWVQNMANAQDILMVGGAGQGNQALDVDWQVPGGWVNPGDPTNYDVLNFSSLGGPVPNIDFQAGGSISMLVQVEAGWDADLMKTNYFLIEYTGDQWAQTWIPGPAQLMPWWSPHEYPAVIGPAGWTPPEGSSGITENTVLIRPGDGWKEVVIHDVDFVPWAAPLVNFNAMTGINLQLWSAWTDSSGASGNYKLDGTATVWPAGPISGSIDVDYIRYIPEPATIALLGLGGLALLRKRS